MRRLSVRLVVSFLVLALLTALAVGLPAIWLMEKQLDNQARSQIEQGESTVLATFEKQYLELENYAILTAQRPTLQSLLNGNDLTGLTVYLEILQEGANLDLINICLHSETLAGTLPDNPACREVASGHLFLSDISANQESWMIAGTSLDQLGENVVVGIRLDQDYAAEISHQIGMELVLFYQGSVISSSIPLEPGLTSQLEMCQKGISDQSISSCSIAGSNYYASLQTLDLPGWSTLLALDTSPIQQARSGLVYSMSGAILTVAVVGTLLGVLLSRLVSRPLEDLSRTAGAFSQGDLETGFVSESRVMEINQVATALENARVELIHTLKSLEAEKGWSENLLASIIEAIITLDEDGKITFFSHGAERLTGMSAQEASGRQIDEVFILPDGEGTLLNIISSEPAGYQRLDLSLPDDRKMTCAITSAPLNRSGVFEEGEKALVIRDISEEEAVHRLLGHFIADVAHELRTPLTALEASIEMLLDQEAALNEADRKELNNSLYLGILGLHTLVDNLLESANIEARHFSISPRITNLQPIVSRAVQTMQPLLSKYEQRLTLELPLDIPLVKADPKRTEQVLVNLISNANRYGPTGEEIILQVSLLDRHVRIAVKDRGPGISPEHRDDLFRRFEFPHDQNSASQAGAGLGLSVVKEIVDAHGGEVSVEDHPGGGSIFWFTIPIAKERG